MRRGGLLLFMLAGLAGLGAVQAAADDLWKEDFITGWTANAKPLGWYDDSDNPANHAMIYYNTTVSYADVTVTTGQGYGKVISFYQDVNVSVYPKLDIVVHSIPAGDIKVGIFIPGNTATAGYEEHVGAAITTTGTTTIDIPTLSGGWTGIKAMGIEIWVEGTGGHAVIDSVRIYNTLSSTPTYTPTPSATATVTPTVTPYAGTPTFTATITPTATITATALPATETNFWLEPFTGGANGAKPPRWQDATNVAANDAYIAYVNVTSGANEVMITHVLKDTWGQVLSPTLQVDTSLYNLAEINVVGLGPQTYWNIGIQEIGGNSVFNKNFTSADSQLIGKIPFNINDVMGWTPGVHIFQFHIMVVGPVNSYFTVNSLRVYRSSNLPFPTSTPTPATANGWVANFTPVAGRTLPVGWTDSSADASKHLYSDIPGYVYLSRTASAPYGSVLSPAIPLNVTRYPYLSISVKNMSPNALWKVGIADNGPDKFYADLNASWNLEDTKVYNYAAILQQYNNVTTWAGTQNFNIILTMESPGVETVEISDLHIFGLGPDPTQTITPSFTATPWVQLHNVLAYPNPSRDKVSFAYQTGETVSVTLDVYKLTGERVGNVIEQQTGSLGTVLQTVWDATNVAPGVYLCHLKAVGTGGRTWVDVVKKVAIVK
jgi:hypothetical protein